MNSKKINIPDPKRAACYYYVIKCAFNNSCHNPISKEADWNRKMLEDLKYTRKKLDNVMIENLDFRDLTTRYPPKPTDFWYLDPPYVIAGERKDYYFFSFSDEDHKDFIKMCDEINELGGKFMVSYDDRKEVTDAYKNYNIMKIPIRYSGQLYNKNYKNELVITNYEQAGQESLF
jgi:DNA adenine methylase